MTIVPPATAMPVSVPTIPIAPTEPEADADRRLRVRRVIGVAGRVIIGPISVVARLRGRHHTARQRTAQCHGRKNNR